MSVTFESSWRSPAVRAFVGRGDIAPALPAETIDGGPAIDLAALRGQRVLLLFWFPTCGPCLREVGDLARRRDELSTKFDGQIVGVCWTDAPEEAQRTAEALGAPFRSVLDRRGVGRGCAAGYQVRSFPSAVLVGADGRIEQRRVLIDQLLDLPR